MAAEIPSQFQFEELLSHTFPGFFLAITLFMLVDILSPLNFTSWAIKDISSLATFVGFVVIFGTILGVIIDGIHHSIVEDEIFENILGLKVINKSLKALYPSSEFELSHRYFFKIIGDKATEIDRYIINAMYRYSEFYANTFISLIPFSFVLPFYLSYVLRTPWIWSISLALLSLAIAYTCLNSSYVALKDYQRAKFSVISGYLDYCSYINLEKDPNVERIKLGKEALNLKATIADKASKMPVRREGINVIFKTTLGGFPFQKKTDKRTTNRDGVAKITLRSKESGVAIVTATSENCLPGVTWVQFKK